MSCLFGGRSRVRIRVGYFRLPYEYCSYGTRTSWPTTTTPRGDKFALAFSCCNKTKPGTEQSILILIIDCGVFCTLKLQTKFSLQFL